MSQQNLVARTSGKTPTREVTPEAVCDREAKGLAMIWLHPRLRMPSPAGAVERYTELPRAAFSQGDTGDNYPQGPAPECSGTLGVWAPRVQQMPTRRQKQASAGSTGDLSVQGTELSEGSGPAGGCSGFDT